jgi:hypothetical protein
VTEANQLQKLSNPLEHAKPAVLLVSILPWRILGGSAGSDHSAKQGIGNFRALRSSFADVALNALLANWSKAINFLYQRPPLSSNIT